MEIREAQRMVVELTAILKDSSTLIGSYPEKKRFLQEIETLGDEIGRKLSQLEKVKFFKGTMEPKRGEIREVRREVIRLTLLLERTNCDELIGTKKEQLELYESMVYLRNGMTDNFITPLIRRLYKGDKK